MDISKTGQSGDGSPVLLRLFCQLFLGHVVIFSSKNKASC